MYIVERNIYIACIDAHNVVYIVECIEKRLCNPINWFKKSFKNIPTFPGSLFKNENLIQFYAVLTESD